MSMMRLILIAALGLGLAGCSGGTGSQRLFPQLVVAAKSSIATKRVRQAARPPLTRAALDELDGSFIEVTLERSDLLAYLFVSTERRDHLPGRIIQWRTEDGVTLTTRNGMLIATRGLGGDLFAAQVPAREGFTGPAHGGERIMSIRTGDLEMAQLVLACDRIDLGAETIVIVERAHSTQHLREECTTDGGRVQNDYWVDHANGVLWQSTQWAGPHVGYLRTRRLTK